STSDRCARMPALFRIDKSARGRTLKPGSGSAPGEPLAQHAVLDLPGGGARHFDLRDERDRARALVAGHLVATPVENVLLGRVCALVQPDAGVHGLAPFLVGNADHRDVLHARVAAENVLDLARVDILSAADDHVALAVDEMNEALLVAPRQVADAAIAVG